MPPIRSFTESTLLDLVTADGRSGFMVRIARNVDEGTGWVWLVTYGPDGVSGFVEDRFACAGHRTKDDATGAEYVVEMPVEAGAEATVHRRGTSETPLGGHCVVDVLGHSSSDIPRGPGSDRLRVQAAFTVPDRPAGSNLPGRSESIVDVEATLTVNGVTRHIRGMGQFHEQLQDSPRFDTPFTYMSLRGVDLSLIGLKGPRAGGGVVISVDGPEQLPGLEIDAYDKDDPWRRRQFGCGVDATGAPRFLGHLEPTVRYSIPIGDGRRPSAIVRGELNGRAVTGFLNDWTPPGSGPLSSA